MFNQLIPAFRMILVLTVLTGLIYPAAVTGVAHVLFSNQARGSLIERDGKVVGSTLIGQNFSKPIYFHPRPSAAGNDGYDATSSSGSNFGPTNQKLVDRMKASGDKFRAENPTFTGPIPADLTTTSASGLDPDVSPASAYAQAARVAQARGVEESQVRDLIAQSIQGRTLGLFGDPRVNVLALNLALDEKLPVKSATVARPVSPAAMLDAHTIPLAGSKTGQ
jgi:K+-transporting ATPase ATPase C chain